MIEHVRRRLQLSKKIHDVIVTTKNKRIEKIIKSFHGKVILTKKKHFNGTSRVSEITKKLNCTHVLIVQGDEPLILPSQIDLIAKKIILKPNIDIWCATSILKNDKDLDRKSIVKCIVDNNKIYYFFRRSPSHLDFQIQKKNIKKIQGLIVFKKEVLLKYPNFVNSTIEKKEKIEQIRYLINGYEIESINISPSHSINYFNEVDEFYKSFKKSKEQKIILSKIMQNV